MNKLQPSLSLSRSRVAQTLIVLVLALGACEARAPFVESPPAAPALVSPLTPPASSSVADVAARATPSVVSIFSERSVKVLQPRLPLHGPFSPFGDPFFDFFFEVPRSPRGGDNRAPMERSEESLGSGVIVSSDGIVLTNHHVVAHADKIKVKLDDGRELNAKLLGSDEKSDVAVLRVDGDDLPAIAVADSSRVRVGDAVLAIGNPFGVGQTVTMGIISAVGRANVGITDYEDFIQTDAAINPGNSGGALVSMDGALVGINTAIVSRSGGFQGIGFAIPSNMAMTVKEAIVKDGRVVRGWLGVAIQDVTEELARSLDLPSRKGALVSDVTTNGPAAKAGLQRGDVIVSLNGTKLKDSAHLRNLVALSGKGARVQLVVLRDSEERSIEAELGELPSSDSAERESSEEASGVFEGVTVTTLDDEERARRQAPRELSGVVVERLNPSRSASRAGLRRGDVIIEVNRSPVPSVAAFEKASRAAESRALLLVWRDGVTIFLALSK